MSAPRLLAPTTISGGVPTAGAGTLNTIALWTTPDGNTLGNSLLTQAGNVTTNSGTFRTADGNNTEPGYTFSNSSGSGMYRGTSGTILRFASSGAFAFGVSSTGNVLIGGTATTTPGGRLDVVGVAGSSWAIRAQVSSANTSPALNAELGLNLKNTSATVGNYTSITNRDSADNANTQINFINVNNSGSGAINFVTRDSVGGSAERVRITETGFVGIGTPSPTATSTIYKANNSLGAWNAQDLSVDGLSNGDAVYQRWYATGVAGAVGRFGVTFQSSVASFVWNSLFNSGVQTAELMRLTGGGFLGIGTASPVSRTDIAGASVDQLAWGVLSVRSSDAQGADKGGSLAFGGLYDATNSTHWAQISGRKENGTSGQYGGYLAFATRTNGAGANTERARIDSAGNLILNTANTGATIQAAGSQQGLKLPATPGNADTQTLDAYQEMGSGTYAAVTATLTCGTSGTITLKTTSDQDKLYVTRIGRTVHVSGYLVVDSVSSPTGRLTITTSTALPAVKNGASANIVFTGPTGLVAGDIIQPTISASTIFCDVYNGGVQSQTGAAKMQANTSLWVSFSYHAA